VEIYGKGRVFAADFQRWMHLSMRPLPKVTDLAGNHGRQLELPVFLPVWLLSLTEYIMVEPGSLDAGSD
jgi:hypothetical protein